MQTLWAAKVRRRPRIKTRPERLELPDGDFVDLAWTADAAPDTSPLVAIFHGLEGDIASPYAAGILKQIVAGGMAGVLMHFRGCSGEPNRLKRAYHAGETGDIRHLLGLLGERFPGRPLMAVGYSLGANALICYLSEEGAAAAEVLKAAVAVSPPLQLSASAVRLQKGSSRMYQGHLLRQLKLSALAKPQHVDASLVRSCRSIFDFDERITAPIHGFGDAPTYYAQCSSGPRLKDVRIPLLVLHASDDPFMTPDVVPDSLPDDSPVRVELSARGGHVGFVSGLGRYWLEERIPAYLAQASSRR